MCKRQKFFFGLHVQKSVITTGTLKHVTSRQDTLNTYLYMFTGIQTYLFYVCVLLRVYALIVFTMKLLNKSLINSETWIACQTLCPCPFLCVVVAYSLHHGLVCCRGMLRSVGEGSMNVGFPHWHGEEEKMVAQVSRSNLTVMITTTKNMWGNHIQTLYMHFFTKITP